MEPELPHYQFHRDTDGSLHMAWRAISEAEVVDVLEGAPEEQHRRDGRVVALGRTADGRFLRVVYRILPETGTIFVITAFEPGPQVYAAWRRRRRKKS